MTVEFEGPAGRIEGLLDGPTENPRAAVVFAHPHPLLDVPAATCGPLLERFDMFVITEDVTLGDLSGRVVRLALHGPRASAVLAAALHRHELRTMQGLVQLAFGPWARDPSSEQACRVDAKAG